LAHEDLPGLRHRLQPRGHVHRLADHGVLHALLAADVAGDGRAGVEPERELHLDAVDLPPAAVGGPPPPAPGVRGAPPPPRPARSASSGRPSGAPHPPMTASPTNLSMMPPRFCTISVATVNSSFSKATVFSGEILSRIWVNPHTSANSTVTWRTSPPRRSRAGSLTMRSTTSGDRKRDSDWRIAASSRTFFSFASR